ncbi:hypothetical protein BOX15_Mlig033116g2, partial [Macrostomum lignano]
SSFKTPQFRLKILTTEESWLFFFATSETQNQQTGNQFLDTMDSSVDHRISADMPRRRLEFADPDCPPHSHQQHQLMPQQGGDCSIPETAAVGDAEIEINERSGVGGSAGGGSGSSLAGSVAVPTACWKTLLALACMGGGMLLTAISLAYVHDYVPEYPPLPDVSLRLVPRSDWALMACEALLLLNMSTALALCLAHRHRWVLLRRTGFILAIVFLYRSVTIAVTAMPDPNARRHCGPRSNSSLNFAEIYGRVSRIAMGAGFSVSNTHNICGDSIFSGHTASLTLSYLTIREYTPATASPLRWASLITCLISFMLLLSSHAHYTVDLIIGYWLASRLFLVYHALAKCPSAERRSSHLAQVWWYRAFEFFEAGVPGRLPCEFQLPWPHGCCQRAYRRLGSFRERLLRGFTTR